MPRFGLTKFIFIVLPVILLAYPTFTFAQSYGVCNPTYGNPNRQTFQLSVSKSILNPNTGQFVANLNLNDHNFNPGDTVTFHIDVQNTGNTALGPITVVDTIPDFTEFVSGPGSLNTTGRQLTYTISSLDPGKTDEQTVDVKVLKAGLLTFSGGIDCLIQNNVQASATSIGTVTAFSRFCIQKQALGVTTVPSTGSETYVLLGLAGSLIGGIGLLKKSRKSSV